MFLANFERFTSPVGTKGPEGMRYKLRLSFCGK